MSVFKVLGGIAAGVGAIAALPVFGAVGAVTAAGAAVGAVVGGIAGAVASEMDEEEKTEIRSSAQYEGAKAAEKLLKEKFEKEYNEKLKEMLKDTVKRDQFLVVMTAIGISMANADGKISDEELLEIQFMTGDIEKNPSINEKTKEAIKKIIEEKPSFYQALHFVDQADKELYPLIGECLSVIAHADGKLHPAEEKILYQWNEFYKVNK